MKPKFLTLALAVLATTANATDDGYRPTPIQVKVDRSFSDILIDAPFRQARPHLIQGNVDKCRKADCEWRGHDGVRYIFDGDPGNLSVVIKRIDPKDFDKRPIPALGLGLARSRGQVFAALKTFGVSSKPTCIKSDDGGENCQIFLKPGWLSLGFDAKGRLNNVQLDGYHFT